MSDTSQERRIEPRERTASRLRIAYFRGEAIPFDYNLVDVDCHDVSRSGCAYWTRNRPDATDVLIVFGEGDREVRLKARVVRWEVGLHKDRLYTLIGCKFLERLESIPTHR
jgi:hypothetical protein